LEGKSYEGEMTTRVGLTKEILGENIRFYGYYVPIQKGASRGRSGLKGTKKTSQENPSQKGKGERWVKRKETPNRTH